MRALVPVLAFVIGLGAGCVTDPSAVAENRGNSFRYLRDAQVENPEPLPGRADGLDPRTAEHVLENYSEGQKEQEHGSKQKAPTGSSLFGSSR